MLPNVPASHKPVVTQNLGIGLVAAIATIVAARAASPVNMLVFRRNKTADWVLTAMPRLLAAKTQDTTIQRYTNKLQHI